ncbi:MAG: efflux RND transporter periplasmic adaptor subunit [Candidatus Cryptobacteroides sp.]|nr:efflux RND transporter periplasmic adaptor subunit [Candidatus Cryptobacteroides sp.]
MKKLKKLIAVGVSLSLFMSLLSCENQGRLLNGSSSRKPSEVTVQVKEVGQSSSSGTSSYVGRVEASKLVTVSASASGTLVSLDVREGQQVSRSQVLARIESQALKSSLQMARASYNQAEDALRRLEKVYESGSIPEVKMVEMRTNYAKAEAALRAAEKAVEDCAIKAPVAGVVSDVAVVCGEQLTIAAPMFRIVDTRSLEVHFPLPENEAVLFGKGDRATVCVPALGKSCEALLTGKAVLASPLSHSYDCTLTLTRPLEGMVPGMVCKVSFSSTGAPSIVVPASAVMTGSESRYVWTVTDSVVRRCDIVVGGYEGDGIIVSEGLSPGDRVVVGGVRKVSTGMKVKTVE